MLLFAVILGISTVNVSAAKFMFEPSGKELIEGCDSEINIMLDIEGEGSNAADIEVKYNPAEIEIIDSNGNLPGVQIKNGTAYEAYFGNQVNTSTGVIRLAGASFVSPLYGKGKFATIQFKSKPGVLTTKFTIDFTKYGDTLDSNIAEFQTSDDLLDGVTNGTYTFVTGSCNPDKIPPTIVFEKPSSSSDNSEEASPISIPISDAGSGVDLDSVVIKLNGKEYRASDPDVTVTGDKFNYVFTFVPREELPSDESSIIFVTAKDFSGNVSNKRLVFNYPYEEPPLPPDPEPCPECECDEDAEVIEVVKDSPLTSGIVGGAAIDALSALPDTVAAAVLSIGIIACIIAILMLLLAPFLFLAIMGILKRNKPWGVVYNQETGKPIAGAVVRLYSDLGDLIGQVVTNRSGRYGFETNPGRYRLSIEDPNYITYNLDIEVYEEEIVEDVYLIPKPGSQDNMVSRASNLLQRRGAAIAYFGLILSMFAVFVSPNIINIIFLVVYLALSGFFIWQKIKDMQRKRK